MEIQRTDLFCVDRRESGDVRRLVVGWPERDREAEPEPGELEAELLDTTPSPQPGR